MTLKPLDEVLEALEADHEFLIQRDVFTADILETWINCKRERGSTRSACSPIHTNPEGETRNRIALPSLHLPP